MKKRFDTRFPIQNGDLAQFWMSRRGGVQIIVDLLIEGDPRVLLYIPFTGSERICWECKGPRELLITMDIHGKAVSWSDVCNPREDA